MERKIRENFWEIQWAVGESMVQIMVDEYRDAQIDRGEGLLWLVVEILCYANNLVGQL